MRSWRCGLVVTSIALVDGAQSRDVAAPPTLGSIAVLRPHGAPAVDTDTACLAAAVGPQVMITAMQCVRALLASNWTAQFLEPDLLNASRLVASDTVPVASINWTTTTAGFENIDTDDNAVAVVYLQRPPTTWRVFHPGVNLVTTDRLFTVVHIDRVAHELQFLPNVTRLPAYDCDLHTSEASVASVCVNVSRTNDESRWSLLLDQSDPVTLYGLGLPTSSGNATTFAWLPNVDVELSSVVNETTTTTTPEESESDGQMGTYVLTPDAAASTTPAPSFMAGLRLEKNGSNYCGGSLISARVVLTAAHCLDSGQVPTFVSIGSTATAGDDPQAEQLAVEIVTLHPQYDRVTKANDLALVVLKTTSTNTPIRLENRLRLAATRATVYGYGVTHEEATELSPTLRSVELPLITSRRQCESLFGATLDASFLCAGGEQGRDACTGDSGGPLVIEDGSSSASPSLLGVVSAGDGCGVQGRPGLYAWVGSASAVAFISMHVPDAAWKESVQINGVTVPVVASQDDAVQYPQFVNGSSFDAAVAGPGTVGPPGASSSTPEPRDGAPSSPSLSSPALYRVEFGGEDLTPFTRSGLLQFLASGSTHPTNSTSAASATDDTSGNATDRSVRFTLVSSARLDTLVAVISRHDTLALHRRRGRQFSHLG